MQYPKNSQIFDAVSMSCAFITQFLNMINCIKFNKGDDSSFASSSQTVNGINVRLWKCTVICRAYGMSNFECQQTKDILGA